MTLAGTAEGKLYQRRREGEGGSGVEVGRDALFFFFPFPSLSFPFPPAAHVKIRVRLGRGVGGGRIKKKPTANDYYRDKAKRKTPTRWKRAASIQRFNTTPTHRKAGSWIEGQPETLGPGDGIRIGGVVNEAGRGVERGLEGEWEEEKKKKKKAAEVGGRERA